jgi:hypothetical protein
MTEKRPATSDLRRRIRRDLLLDTLGNVALGLGLWGWLGHGDPAWLQQPAVFIALTATGVLNLLHLPARLRRLREWQRRR